jgi:hypothetical protein
MPPKQGQQPPSPPPPPPAGDEEEECVSNKEVRAMMEAMTKLFKRTSSPSTRLLSGWNTPLLESLIELRPWRLDCQ